MAKLSEIIDSQTTQISTLKNDLSKDKILIEKYKSSAEENGNLAIELKSKLDSGQMQLKKIENIRNEEVSCFQFLSILKILLTKSKIHNKG